MGPVGGLHSLSCTHRPPPPSTPISRAVTPTPFTHTGPVPAGAPDEHDVSVSWCIFPSPSDPAADPVTRLGLATLSHLLMGTQVRA
jgi:hypothetical protein